MREYTKDSLLFDLNTDKEQKHPIQDAKIEDRMKRALVEQLEELEAPEEQFKRLELDDLE